MEVTPYYLICCVYNKKTSAFARKGRKFSFRGTTFINDISHPTLSLITGALSSECWPFGGRFQQRAACNSYSLGIALWAPFNSLIGPFVTFRSIDKH
ncbi:hypothetical protein D3C77_498790 [compost metagenome]